MLSKDKQRKTDYDSFNSLIEQFVQDGQYLRGEARMAEEGEYAEYLDVAKGYNELKKIIATRKYAAKYAKFQLDERVQIVLGNRVFRIGTISEIQVLTSPQTIFWAYNSGKHINYLRDWSLIDIKYILDEFIFNVSCSPLSIQKNKKQLLPPDANAKAAIITLLPIPARLLTECPVCKSPYKPLMNALLGGEFRIMCYDCYYLIKDMYGCEYTKNTLTFNELYKSKKIDTIARLSLKI